ncbi:bifunctional HTH-domain containing protein/aminotransferase [Clostridioides difficile]|nr:bifunctional HTH-domain containing protein/aminotransferase [Clostridioides difficile]
MNTIAERIKFAMKAKNKKQVDIVKDTGISKGAFSSYLSGQYNPKADKMELIADSLDVDLRWLYGQNVPMEHTSQNDNALQYVFYNNSCSEYLLDDLDDIYIAMMTQYAALIPRFYVLVNRAGNAMHILPLFLKEDSSQFYECPSDFFYSDRHTIFTRDFESIHMVLTTATIYYYGIDTKTYEPKVTMLSYSQADDCFHINNGIQGGHIKAFEKELMKEALYLKHNDQYQTRGLARFLTFQVLYCIMVLLAMSVPSRTALRRIGFALFLDLTTFSLFLDTTKACTNFLQSDRLSFFHILYQFFYSTIQVTAQFTD